MNYDPIKRKLGGLFNRKLWTRKLFYRLLDLLLLRSWYVRKEIRKWQKLQSQPANILDAGSGFGQYTYNLSRINSEHRILGVDISEDHIKECTSFFNKLELHKNVSFKTADLTNFHYDGFYDLIISVDVMEHILEDELVFKNFYRSLREGGQLLISTPSDKGGSDVHEESDESFIGEHVRDGYNMEEILEKLKRAGFSRADAFYSYGIPGKISWRFSMKYPIMMLNFSKISLAIIPLYYLITFPFCLILNFLDLQFTHPSGTGLIVKAWK